MMPYAGGQMPCPGQISLMAGPSSSQPSQLALMPPATESNQLALMLLPDLLPIEMLNRITIAPMRRFQACLSQVMP